jgi:hypothetical protein
VWEDKEGMMCGKLRRGCVREEVDAVWKAEEGTCRRRGRDAVWENEGGMMCGRIKEG